MIWFEYIVCAAVILISGSFLSHYGELIADKSGFSKGWVGLVLLALMTSLSQLVTSISAVVIHGLPDMAVAGLIGSCMFNSMVIGLLDLTSKNSPVSNKVHQGHLLAVGFGVILMALAAIDFLMGNHLPILYFFHSMDPITILFVPLYLIAMRLMFKFEQMRISSSAQNVAPEKIDNKSWFALLLPFSVCGLCIVGASVYLPDIANQIAISTGWGQSFLGSSLIAVTACLPELAVSISAARRGSFDMAVGSLLGANLCYIVILAITDFCYLKEPLLRHVSLGSSIAALSAIISMGILVVGLTYRSERKFLFIAGDAVALILVYVLANVLLFVIH
jgi:cation:H+ antiporter